MTVIKTWMKNPIRGTASAITANPKPTPSETHASRSIVPGLLVYFFRFRFGAASGAGRGTRSAKTGSEDGILITAPHFLHRDLRPAKSSSTSNAFPQPSHENAIIVDLRAQTMERL